MNLTLRGTCRRWCFCGGLVWFVVVEVAVVKHRYGEWGWWAEELKDGGSLEPLPWD